MPYSDKSSRRFGCLVSLALPIAFLALAFGWFAGMPYTSNFPKSFDIERWSAADPRIDSIRYSMITDLKYRIEIVGRSREDLSKMLGTSQSLTRDPNVTYWLLCPSFLDNWVLRVRWENDRAIEAVVHQT